MAQPAANTSLIWTHPSVRFQGVVFIQNDGNQAINYAQWAVVQPPVVNQIHLTMCCDCSKDKVSDQGGIAVSHATDWVPGLPHNEVTVTAAWPVDGMYDPGLGEFLALAECLAVATQQIRQFAGTPVLAGQYVTVRIFNDNKHNLEYLQGRRSFGTGLMTMVKPVVDLIATQTSVLHQLGVLVRLELHWIPGHDHDVKPHVEADSCSRKARLRRRGYSTVSGNIWQRAEEPSVVRYLKPHLMSAAVQAAHYIPGLNARIAASYFVTQPPARKAKLRQRKNENKPVTNQTQVKGAARQQPQAVHEPKHDTTVEDKGTDMRPSTPESPAPLVEEESNKHTPEPPSSPSRASPKPAAQELKTAVPSKQDPDESDKPDSDVKASTVTPESGTSGPSERDSNTGADPAPAVDTTSAGSTTDTEADLDEASPSPSSAASDITSDGESPAPSETSCCTTCQLDSASDSTSNTTAATSAGGDTTDEGGEAHALSKDAGCGVANAEVKARTPGVFEAGASENCTIETGVGMNGRVEGGCEEVSVCGDGV
jgi:hypothetical protein